MFHVERNNNQTDNNNRLYISHFSVIEMFHVKHILVIIEKRKKQNIKQYIN